MAFFMEPGSHSKNDIINKLRPPGRIFLLAGFALLISMKSFGQLTADFSVSSINICSGSPVTFTDNSSGISDSTTYNWSFGEGASPSTATGIGPHTVIYTGSGKSTVSLTISEGISNTSTSNDYVTVNLIPYPPIVTVSDNCDSTSTLSTTSEGTLLWSTKEMSSAIIVRTIGVYTVTTTINGCTSLAGSGTASPKMSPANPVESVDCSLGLNKAVIKISNPLGTDYEYRLDTGPYQSGTSFTNVINGSHIITVRNDSGCTTTGSFFEASCDCVNAATVTLSSSSGNTCGTTAVTVSGNSFGGIADQVTISENGAGSVSPALVTKSPFTFTYTPKTGDEGKTVLITVTTNNPAGTSCVSAKEIYSLTVNAKPVAPVVGKITQPSCSEQTASVELDELPSTGTWTLKKSPGGITTTGNGVSTTIQNMSTGTYTYTVTSETGCISGSSANVVIQAQPVTPPPPVIGLVTYPTCYVSTGSAVLNSLPANGSWILTRSPGGVSTTGSGTNKTISDLPAGKYTFTVTNAAGCTSSLSSEISIPLQPGIPSLIITNPPAVCSSENVDLTTATITAGSTPGLTLSYWTNATGTIPYLTPGTAGEGTYYIKGITMSGCFDVKPVTVTVDPLPIANAGPDQVLEYQFGTALNAELNNEFETGVWSVISGTAEFNDNSLPKTSVSGLSLGKNKFLWTVTNGVCPLSFDTVMIIVHDLEIRKLITPNMDGRNDYFVLHGLSTLGRTELVIFDRSGALVFKNENYDNLWNGVDYNDNPLPDDTYFFVIRPENGRSVSGFIVIRR